MIKEWKGLAKHLWRHFKHHRRVRWPAVKKCDCTAHDVTASSLHHPDCPYYD